MWAYNPYVNYYQRYTWEEFIATTAELIVVKPPSPHHTQWRHPGGAE